MPPNPFRSEPPSVFLQRIRAESCYKTLRFTIELIAWIGYLIAASFLLPAIMGLFLLLRAGPGDEFHFLLFPEKGIPLVSFLSAEAFLTSIGLFVLIVTISIRQASLLLIDISDVLIHSNRIKPPNGDPSP